MKTILFDPACQDLAEHFLADEPYTRETSRVHEDRVRSLSQAIQQAVEDWMVDCPSPYRPIMVDPE